MPRTGPRATELRPCLQEDPQIPFTRESNAARSAKSEPCPARLDVAHERLGAKPIPPTIS